MDGHEGSAAPQSGNDQEPQIPTFEELAADPEIAALLDFAPVPRKVRVVGGWSPDKQRELIARLAVHGSPGPACVEMGMHRTSGRTLYNAPHSESFRAAWDSAVSLAIERQAEQEALAFLPAGTRPPSIDYRRKRPATQQGPLPGQVLNEYDEWEEEDSYNHRAADAKDSVSAKLLRCRRMYLQQIADHPGKRAAFEILTEYPVDWDKARNLEEQDDEPFNIANQRQPDMVLTAQAGWFGDFAHGRNRMAEARAAVDAYRAAEGLPAVDWEDEASTERSEQAVEQPRE